jgi:hypothetical protein
VPGTFRAIGLEMAEALPQQVIAVDKQMTREIRNV